MQPGTAAALGFGRFFDTFASIFLLILPVLPAPDREGETAGLADLNDKMLV